MRRHLLGLIALASLALAAVLCYSPLATYQAAGAMGLRVGLVLGVLWLAWPDLHRLPRWAWYVLPIGCVVLIYARQLSGFSDSRVCHSDGFLCAIPQAAGTAVTLIRTALPTIRPVSLQCSLITM